MRTDDRITCPNCQKTMVPRLAFQNGKPAASYCPFCAHMVHDFRPSLKELLKKAFRILGIIALTIVAFFLISIVIGIVHVMTS